MGCVCASWRRVEHDRVTRRHTARRSLYSQLASPHNFPIAFSMTDLAVNGLLGTFLAGLGCCPTQPQARVTPLSAAFVEGGVNAHARFPAPNASNCLRTAQVVVRARRELGRFRRVLPRAGSHGSRCRSRGRSASCLHLEVLGPAPLRPSVRRSSGRFQGCFGGMNYLYQSSMVVAYPEACTIVATWTEEYEGAISY